jgi:Icc protein
MSQPAPLLVAQITDTHLFADPSQQMKRAATYETLQTVLERVDNFKPKPDILLLTGDLSQDETPESYHNLHALVSPLAIPAYWIPGNHDCPSLMAEILDREPIFPHKSFQQGGWQFILLNSAVPGCVGGELSESTLDWLEQQLEAAGDRPTLVSLHHHPLPVNSAWMDDLGLQNPGDLLTILDRYSQVRLVIFGHIHQEFERERKGIQYFGTPSTCVQFTPRHDEFAIDPVPPGFRLLALYPDGTWTTKVERVDRAFALD